MHICHISLCLGSKVFFPPCVLNLHFRLKFITPHVPTVTEHEVVKYWHLPGGPRLPPKRCIICSLTWKSVSGDPPDAAPTPPRTHLHVIPLVFPYTPCGLPPKALYISIRVSCEFMESQKKECWFPETVSHGPWDITLETQRGWKTILWAHSWKQIKSSLCLRTTTVLLGVGAQT